MRKTSVFVLILVFGMSLGAVPVRAEAPPVETAGDYFSEITKKFAHGLGDILSSPAEVFCVPVYEVRENGASGILTGVGKGLVFMLRRILSGTTEAVTFMIPMEPILPPACTKPAAASASAQVYS